MSAAASLFRQPETEIERVVFAAAAEFLDGSKCADMDQLARALSVFCLLKILADRRASQQGATQ